jgi:hypothetical protein
LAKEFFLVRQKGERDELERTGKIIEPFAPDTQPLAQSTPAVGKNFRGDLLGFHYSVVINARDWKEIMSIVRLALRDGWRLKQTYRGMFFPWLPVAVVKAGVWFKGKIREAIR